MVKVVAARGARLLGLAMVVLKSRAKGSTWIKLSRCILIKANFAKLN